MALPKTYEATMRLGETTDTWDADGAVTERRDPSDIRGRRHAARARTVSSA